ncbi:MAG: DUF3429 domain-containing protein [Pseudomonadota bacterium]
MSESHGQGAWPEELREALREHELVAVTSGLTDLREAEALLQDALPGRWTRLEWGMGSARNRDQFRALQEATGLHMLPLFVTRDGVIGGQIELREWLDRASGASRPGPALEWTPGVVRQLQILGLGGLIPFVVTSGAAWMARPEWQVFALEALAVYGAVILAFLGAVHWGLYLADRGHRVGPLPGIWWAVVPAILAWLALLRPLPEALMTLAVLFLGALWVDRMSLRGRALPPGYLGLRTLLTAGAILALALGLGAALHSTGVPG